MRFLFLAALCTLLTSAALPLAIAPPLPPPPATPACSTANYPDTAALLAALPGADYACAEELATALRVRAEQTSVTALIELAAQAERDTRARRNALRALGRIAESPRHSHAAELILRRNGAAIRTMAVELLQHERDNFLLQDAVWLLDTFFYPSLGAAPALEAVAANPGLAPALRYRAAAARARLVLARPGPLAPADLKLILDGLQASDPGVRTAAATAAAHLRPDQQTADPILERALASAWAAEPPPFLAPDPPDPRAISLLSFQESSPTSLSARTALARARDRIAGSVTHLPALRADYEALALPYQLTSATVTLRAGLAPTELPELLAEVERTRAAFVQIVGPELAQPLPDEPAPTLTVLVFARQGIYRDYMRAFTPFSVDVDGIYDELSATLYTHQRTVVQSENTLLETLRHQLAHHYAATMLFPGHWRSPGYHREPKGWADEGLAEVLAGLSVTGPAPRPAQLARLCARPHLPPLGPLLARREGYDRFGRFDYEAAWAFSFYLYEQHPAALRRIYAAYRDGSYRLSAWERIAQLPLAQTEATWHQAIRSWCAK